MDRTADRDLKARAFKVIPNGMYGHEAVHALPATFPQFFERAEGAYIWDADGNRYLDFMCAYGPSLLGYRDQRVDAAAAAQAAKGDTMTGPSPVMVDLAEALVSMVTHADWAMFCKNGTDATSMAMVAARAQTGKRIVLLAKGAYHGAAPWCTPNPVGVVAEDRAMLRYYEYNNAESLEAAVRDAGEDLAAIFATPFKHDAFFDQALPDPVYARRARELCDETGAMLVVDDVRAGFRLARDCSWSLVGVQPDLSCWGKAVANGQPLSILLGSDRCRKGAGSIYVTGSYWFAAVPMAASLETLRIIRESDYLEQMIRMGDRLRAGLASAAERHGFGLRQTGPSQMPIMLFDDDPDLRVGFAWAEEMLQRGVYIHPWHNMFIAACMTEADVDMAVAAADGAFAATRERMAELQPSPVILAMAAAKAAEELQALA
ncbi:MULTISPECIES: aminotransferase class III-fold pyridoxal phosphate-dependent enzyme [unclassified Novosphingobium]|uniref:aminotransferase class III-fold pyridoxal phosphate-dependent enzyme n=1 Tax=unclassified Novosphingobium TaxID=2644732 RepID=UPI00149444A0|nr:MULTISPECIES: aminotransferase class III-fold pyridoxal phosphate-dependent enzyme [unclassified Novosphingobium]MBB3358268.1 glutamate-1-semialdehyde 2,1-aminomutase [Novosphingobium sp. BK256]MBB3374629.1 glutamate-1-semialdehyde 2,1-aminomutase [Novosphingobium sp. BK280]MBB3379041.1 glutamate-1-semialdehyde 2,1-aminomutase [Novosphingobium sp. BK258]MBB3420735.1 glutamate-1-semialdehyde 2,1-aminomutase [Novosphingobium sp. BK267]MBB3448143.1 glutamate-1-semialdehyde 2,1-aminomutase [Nov